MCLPLHQARALEMKTMHVQVARDALGVRRDVVCIKHALTDVCGPCYGC